MGIPFKKNGVDGVMRYIGKDPIRVLDMAICPGLKYRVTTYDDVTFGTTSLVAEVTIVDGLGVCLRYESNEAFEADWKKG